MNDKHEEELRLYASRCHMTKGDFEFIRDILRHAQTEAYDDGYHVGLYEGQCFEEDN